MTALDMPIDEFKARIERETKRLYAEDRMTGDEMRDMAHRLTALVTSAFELPDNDGDAGGAP